MLTYREGIERWAAGGHRVTHAEGVLQVYNGGKGYLLKLWMA